MRLTPLGRCWDKGSSHLLENLLCPLGMEDIRPAVCPGSWGSDAARAPILSEPNQDQGADLANVSTAPTPHPQISGT